MKNLIPNSLLEMKGVLTEATRRLNIEEGSLAHEELASRILELFQNDNDPNAVLVAALKGSG
jgi:hypothetical protein